MSEIKNIASAFRTFLSDYGSSFSVRVNQPDVDCDYEVEITYTWGDQIIEYDFCCRINMGQMEINVYEDVYRPLTECELFTQMWFKEIMND